MENKFKGMFPIRRKEGNKYAAPTEAQRDRMLVVSYLQTIKVEGMRKHLCFSCAVVKLYDKNNKQYDIPRSFTLAQVKSVIEEIKKVNEVGHGSE